MTNQQELDLLITRLKSAHDEEVDELYIKIREVRTKIREEQHGWIKIQD